MSVSRSQDIGARFDTWLDRYVVPRHLSGNDQAMQAEVNALLHPLLRFAPREGWTSWLDSVLSTLDAKMKTRAWPTVAEVTAACQDAAKTAAANGVVVRSAPASDVRIVANKMLAGEDVGEQWLYGRCAIELERSGLVSQERMTAYRSALFFNLKNFYGEAEAIKMEEELRAKHRSAERLGPIRPPGVLAEKPARNGGVNIPTKPMHTPAPIYEPGDEVVDATPKPTHWADKADPDSPEMQALRAARMRNPLVREALGLPPVEGQP